MADNYDQRSRTRVFVPADSMDQELLRSRATVGNRERTMSTPTSISSGVRTNSTPSQTVGMRERTWSSPGHPSKYRVVTAHSTTTPRAQPTSQSSGSAAQNQKAFRLFSAKHNQKGAPPRSSSSAISISSDVAIQSLSGSVANLTIASNDTANTVKVSNKRTEENLQQLEQPTEHDEAHPTTTKKSKWRWKRFIGVSKRKSDLDLPPRPEIKEDPIRKMDAAILGRLDGMDVLSLGLAQSSYKNILLDSFHPKMTPALMVQDLLWTSSGKIPAEMILEGFNPGDRWIVVMDRTKPSDIVDHEHYSPIPSIESTDDEGGSSVITSEDGSLPIHLLLESMWGANRKPQTKRNADDADGDVMQLAAACSVPIDVDEDTFMVDTPQHLESLHDIASVPLRKGDYKSALEIIFKILHGLQGGDGVALPHLLGSCWHNVGIIQMWQCKYADAIESFEHAVAVRTDTLPLSHPDLAVSLLRHSLALFAVGRFAEAIVALERALVIHPTESIMRAKILNNLGVVYFQSQDVVNALKHFTSALEIQRQWLDGPVLRDSIVYDASMTLGNLGKCYLHKQDYGTAFFVYEEALVLQSTAFRMDHDIILVTLSNLAYAKAKEGNFKKSLQIYRRMLQSQETKFGERSKQTAETRGIMGQIYLAMNNDEEALSCFSRVQEWQRSNMDPNHPAALYIREMITKVTEKRKEGVSVWI